MAEVDLVVAARHYQLACRDGDEPALRELARIVDAKAAEAGNAFGGGVTESRLLLMTALLLADELKELRNAPAPAAAAPPSDPARDADIAEAIEMIAARIERLAEGLETAAAYP